ncbi:glycosyltransferase family A protein [Lysobacter sp. Root983]|uniref:glycosyltransferase family A protein n=1 Tax=Lysobacter sp. Root983 TaxID=1736613 RepID=UPI0007104A81|nr:glycosyltransferase family A protein [Lysobacter sp. Root983]KRD75474.1 hypothetical protein ASE43_11380 [Lysobacter sp. Root983]
MKIMDIVNKTVSRGAPEDQGAAGAMLDVVSVVVRFHDCGSLGKLERAIQSLHAQTGVAVQPIVVTQRFAEADLQKTVQAVQRQWFFKWLPKPLVINYSDGKSGDARSALMNAGIQEHLKRNNRYLAFLDYDDVLYTHAYEVLRKPLASSQAAVSFAGMEQARAVGLRDYDFIYEVTSPYSGKNKLDLIRDNFCPLHSYMIDCAKVDKELLYFHSELSRVEDYDFLLRVAGPSPCDFSALDRRIGLYIIRSDNSNSTPSRNGSKEDAEKERVWKKNREKLDQLRSTYPIKLFASDF